MVKAIKVMLVPNNVQNTKMFQYAGAARFAYNWALAREKDNYEKGGKFISDSELALRTRTFSKVYSNIRDLSQKRNPHQNSIRTTSRLSSAKPMSSLKVFLQVKKPTSKKSIG